VASQQWVQQIGLPPPSGSTDVGQVGVPVAVPIKATPGQTLVVSSSGIVAVSVTYENAGSGQATARAWLPPGTWKCDVVANVTGVVFSPSTPTFPVVPEVSVWVEAGQQRDC